MHLGQPGFTYSACGPFAKNKERIQNFKETGDSKYVYENKLDEAWFQHGMVYGSFKYLPRRSGVNKVLRDKAFNIDKNPQYNLYQPGLASMLCNYFDKKTSNINKETGINFENKELAKELGKPIIWKFEKRKAYSSFIDNIWDADLADM